MMRPQLNVHISHIYTKYHGTFVVLYDKYSKIKVYQYFSVELKL